MAMSKSKPARRRHTTTIKMRSPLPRRKTSSTADGLVSCNGRQDNKTCGLGVDPSVKGWAKRLLKEHEDCLKKAVQIGAMAGCVGTLIHHGKVIFRCQAGYADLERRVPFTHKSLARIYCQGRPFTLLAAMILAENGILDLDAPVAKYLPSMQRLSVLEAIVGDGKTQKTISTRPARKVMLVRHLLTHTAGFSYPVGFGFPANEEEARLNGLLDGVVRGRIKSLAAFVDEVAKYPLLFEPGTRYEYGVSTDVLGRVMEVASGKDISSVLHDSIFEPLGMKDTFFGVPKDKLDRLSGLYGNATTWYYLNRGADRLDSAPIATRMGLVRVDGNDPTESAWAADNVTIRSAGGFVGLNQGCLVSSAQDTEIFLRTILAGGIAPSGSRLVSQDTFAYMERNQLVGPWKPRPWNPVGGYRLCLLGDMIKDEKTTWYQAGGAGGNYWVVDRKRGLAVAVMMQQVDGESWGDVGIDEQKADLDKIARTIVDGDGFKKTRRAVSEEQATSTEGARLTRRRTALAPTRKLAATPSSVTRLAESMRVLRRPSTMSTYAGAAANKKRRLK
eukprot:TRINITY_DN49561_c0_g1_i1.p1 TRINITY_DN49561_c0_g1~~TRINITY_DN49561_c0_g1_i1.p1  ORF type:complete len:559 (-),score=74.35 TRINITY_DN49561_c0_g1_i1:104-1780(-)